MKKGEIIRNRILTFMVISVIGFLFSHFIAWQWGLAISLGLLFGLIVLFNLTIVGMSAYSCLTKEGYLIQNKTQGGKDEHTQAGSDGKAQD